MIKEYIEIALVHHLDQTASGSDALTGKDGKNHLQKHKRRNIGGGSNETYSIFVERNSNLPGSNRYAFLESLQLEQPIQQRRFNRASGCAQTNSSRCRENQRTGFRFGRVYDDDSATRR